MSSLGTSIKWFCWNHQLLVNRGLNQFLIEFCRMAFYLQSILFEISLMVSSWSVALESIETLTKPNRNVVSRKFFHKFFLFVHIFASYLLSLFSVCHILVFFLHLYLFKCIICLFIRRGYFLSPLVAWGYVFHVYVVHFVFIFAASCSFCFST